MKKTEYHVLGVMSGTSLDGIDIAQIWFSLSQEGKWSYTFGAVTTIAYSYAMKQNLKKAISWSRKEIDVFNETYTSYLANEISGFIDHHQIKNIDAVCSHGHTILHEPEKGFTFQIGNLPNISEVIKQTVVCDFRVQDVALGGQGAPLVPIGDHLLFSDYDYCLNLGGFANVSLIRDHARIAYDICPVNIVLNTYAEQLGFSYDDKGDLAKSGKMLLSKSSQLNGLPFYKKQAPKSLGLEWVLKEISPILEGSYALPKDTLRTFTEHAALQIARQFNKGSKVLVTGGGAYNAYLLKRIKYYKDLALVVPDVTLVEYKEALVFGLLGVLKLRNEVNCLASVTGASQDHSSGVVYI